MADLDEAGVTFTRALDKVEGGTVEKGTKADVDYIVALDAKTVEIIRAHRKRCVERALGAGAGLADDAYVFSRAETPDGSKPWYADGANQRFNRIHAKVPGGEKVTPHQLRHWMATSMFARQLRPCGRRRPRRLVLAGDAHGGLWALPPGPGPNRSRRPRPPPRRW